MHNSPQACLVLWALIPCGLVSVRSLLSHSPCRVPQPFPTHLPIHQERCSLLTFLPLSSCQKVGLSFGSFTCHCTLPRPQESWCHFSEGTSGMMKVHVLQFRGLSSSQNLGMFFRPGCPTWTSFPFQSSSVLTTVFLWERSKVFTSPTSSSAFAATSEPTFPSPQSEGFNLCGLDAGHCWFVKQSFGAGFVSLMSLVALVWSSCALSKRFDFVSSVELEHVCLALAVPFGQFDTTSGVVAEVDNSACLIWEVVSQNNIHV
mmetsp:Transcript_22754/g.38109  ORF Transcript_22754/g.38109 Transcript_22754/m.38109 type:complete len:260 (+) Transcript_22754:639-1418(+)